MGTMQRNKKLADAKGFLCTEKETKSYFMDRDYLDKEVETSKFCNQ